MKMIDIPSGYLYGFPREYDKPVDIKLFDWLKHSELSWYACMYLNVLFEATMTQF